MKIILISILAICLSCHQVKDKVVVKTQPKLSAEKPIACKDTLIQSLADLRLAEKDCVKKVILTFQDSVFPREILLCHNLEALLLGQCFELKEIPYEVGNMKRLKDISIFNSPIDSLPSSLCNLDSLQNLDVAFGNLREVPNDFCKYKSLRRANLRGNLIKEVPECVFTMPKFKHLIIRNTDEPLEGAQLQAVQLQERNMPKGFYFEY
jgi:hypothetical protein